MDNLKVVDPKVEGTTLPLSEGEKPTIPAEKPAVSITETKEFQKALQTAVSKGLESIDKQLSIRGAEAKAAKAETEMLKAAQAKYEADFRELAEERDRLTEEQFADDPAALKGYKDSRAIALREKRVKLREEEQNLIAIKQEAHKLSLQLGEVRDELLKKHKVPRKVLEVCQSEEQMREIAKDFPEIAEEPPKEEKTPKFDSTISSGGGGKLTPEAIKGMSPQERFERRKEIEKLPLIK